MATILIASDAQWVIDEISASIDQREHTIISVNSGVDVRGAAIEHQPAVAVLDLQMGNMGGYAVALDLKLESDMGRVPETPVLLLLDRRADVFMARRTGVSGWLLKPLNPIRTRKALEALLAGGTYHDDQQTPSPLNVASP